MQIENYIKLYRQAAYIYTSDMENEEEYEPFEQAYDRLKDAENALNERLAAEGSLTICGLSSILCKSEEQDKDWDLVRLTQSEIEEVIREFRQGFGLKDRYLRTATSYLNTFGAKSLIVELLGLPLLPQQISIKVETTSGADSHNGGKFPLFVEVFDAETGARLGRAVYKPRSAESDIAVMELFRELNQIPGQPTLPVLKIISLPNGDTLWEFIEGKELGKSSLTADPEVLK
ncbi:MAG: DUF4135 domain-containing protein, partial [Simkania negevensis]|nr:DUF4135 domain-containing protein [Simkania negevensis]